MRPSDAAAVASLTNRSVGSTPSARGRWRTVRGSPSPGSSSPSRSGLRGSAPRLLDAAEGWARNSGMTTVQARSRTSRLRAHRFYERAGYRRVKTSLLLAKALGD